VPVAFEGMRQPCSMPGFRDNASAGPMAAQLGKCLIDSTSLGLRDPQRDLIVQTYGHWKLNLIVPSWEADRGQDRGQHLAC